MSWNRWTFCVVLLAACPAWAAERLPQGQVFFATDFEGPNALQGWAGPGVLEAGREGGQSLAVQRRGDVAGSAMKRLVLPVEKMRGHVVRFSAWVKAEGISKKPQPWNGVKFMAPTVTSAGRDWPAVNFEEGSFDWRRASFTARVPDDAQEVALTLGLEAVTGKAWFDDVQVVVWKPIPRLRPRAAAGPVYKGHDLPRLRGAMVSPNVNEESLRVFGKDWNANLIRYQLIRHGPVRDPLDLAAYDRWLASAQEQLDRVLPWCEKYGLKVVVDLHSPPGGRVVSGGGYAGSDFGLFSNAACQRRFVELWQQMARRYKDQKAIWGYDLANEPVDDSVAEDLADWQQLALQTARAVRAIDPDRTIIVEPARWGGPDGFRELEPLDVPKVVYSVHMYVPGEFTHQGVHNNKVGHRYPGEINGRHWDKAALEGALKPVIDFQKAYGVHIYVGEFSAIRWAPDQSAHRYLADLIDIFEAHDWDWSYHAFREWSGWSVEHGSDRQDQRPSPTPTDRQRLLQFWFSKNAKP